MTGHFLYAQKEGTCCIKLTGEIRYTECAGFEKFLDRVLKPGCYENYIIDLTETEYIDSTNLGLLARISRFTYKESGRLPFIFSTNRDVNKLLVNMGFDRAFRIIRKNGEITGSMREIHSSAADRKILLDAMIEAHKELMQMNKKNEKTFKNVVELLENEKNRKNSL